MGNGRAVTVDAGKRFQLGHERATAIDGRLKACRRESLSHFDILARGFKRLFNRCQSVVDCLDRLILALFVTGNLLPETGDGTFNAL